MAFAYPNFDDCTGIFYCMSKWANEVTNYTFFPFLLIGFCVVLYMATYRYGSVRAFGFSSFAGMLSSLFLATLQLLSWWITSAFILISLIGMVFMIMHEK